MNMRGRIKKKSANGGYSSGKSRYGRLPLKTDEAVLTGYVSIDWDAKLKNMAETFKDKFQQNVTVSGGKN